MQSSYQAGGGDARSYFNGMIDELAFYNRALSADEIKSIFAARGPDLANKPKSPAVVYRAAPAENPQPIAPASINLVSQIPTLTISSRSGSLVVSWPAPAIGFVLEGRDSSTSTNWTTVDATPVTNSTQVTVTLPISSSQAFYRLHHP
jgi:hypothetical protein